MATPNSVPHFIDFSLDEIEERTYTLAGVLDLLAVWREHCPQRMARLERLILIDLQIYIWRLNQISEAELEMEVIAAAAFDAD